MAKKKVNRKPGKKANFTPPLECPFTAESIFPHTADSTAVLATKTTEFLAVKEAWKADVRKHFADGGKRADVPAFPASKFVNPNVGRMTRKQNETLTVEYNAALEAGKKPPACPAIYNPIEVDLLHAMGCSRFLRAGAVDRHPKQPKDWDEKRYGPWHVVDENGEYTVPSGFYFDSELPRPCHTRNLRTRIDNPDENIIALAVGGRTTSYVVGTGGHSGSAVFLIRAHKGGNYGACDEARKRMSLAGAKGLANLVFKMEDKPNRGGAFVVKAVWKDVTELCFLPNQVLTAGYLTSNGTELTPAQIRKLDNTKGVKFAPLTEHIVGKSIPWKDDGLWAEIQKVQGGTETKKQREREGRGESEEDKTPQAKGIRNANVECRCDPGERHPFGARSIQMNIVPFVVATGEGNIKSGQFSMGVVVGARSNYEYSVGVNEAKRGRVDAEAEAKPKPKPKAKAKKVAEPKSKKKVAKKESKTKKDEAPAVEVDVPAAEPIAATAE